MLYQGKKARLISVSSCDTPINIEINYRIAEYEKELQREINILDIKYAIMTAGDDILSSALIIIEE